jgi:hypothetical protein
VEKAPAVSPPTAVIEATSANIEQPAEPSQAPTAEARAEDPIQVSSIEAPVEEAGVNQPAGAPVAMVETIQSEQPAGEAGPTPVEEIRSEDEGEAPPQEMDKSA